MNKRFLSRNRLLAEAAESLGQDMLGKPAYAIVMKDFGLYKSKKHSVAAKGTATAKEDSSQLEIQALLERQDEAVTPAEVRANIDGLCPESETYLPEKEFRAIQNKLTEGFLKPQLDDYIDKFKAALKEVEAEVETDEDLEAEVETDEPLESEHEEDGLEAQAEDVQDHADSSEANPQGEADSTTPIPKYPWIRELSPWVRLSSDEVASGGLPEDTDQHLHGYVSEKASRKEKLAVRIMRECWGLHIEELMGGLGQLEVTMRRLEFTMLMRGTRRFLKRINERVLERGESMEVFKSRQTIRFVASRPKTETLIHELGVILQKLRTRNFPASFVGREQTQDVIDGAVLEEVGRISNTFVSQSTSTKKLTVTWLESRGHKQEGEKEYDVEDMRHVVARLLLAVLKPEPVLTKLYAPDQTKALLLSDTPASTFEEDGSATRTVGEPSDVAKLLQDSNIQALEDAEIQRKEIFPYHPVRWSPELHTTTSAVFGHVLLDATGAPAKALTPQIGPNEDLDNINNHNARAYKRRCHAAALLGRAYHPTPLRPYAEPEPVGTQPARPVPRAPPSSNRQRRARDHRHPLHARHHRDPRPRRHARRLARRHPRAAAALRHAAGQPRGAGLWQPIEDFLRRARLDISEGKLEMPEQQRFQIPARLFYKSYPSHIAPPAPTHPKLTVKLNRRTARLAKSIQSRTPNDKNQPISILYEFAGLELHRAVRIPYEGHTLTYTSIEAGQGGGRRAELALSPTQSSVDASPNDASKQLDKPASLQDFLDLVYKTAQTAKFWSGFAP
ncbi:uncharacterized protein PG998_012598 [Apiospora kogelbergensis]|uniref:uncharacterized protein n=1 Tax=Apiospora kogelbergensis TaxID=1337665 RepID=UPI00312FAF84